MASSASSNGADLLSTAQSETYAMLLSMGFDSSNAITAARIFGSDVSAAVNYITSQPPSTSAFYSSSSYTQQPQQSQSSSHSYNHQQKNQKSESNNQSSKLTRRSPDDIAIHQFLDEIAEEMQNILNEDDVLQNSSDILKDLSFKKQENKNKEYVAPTKEEQEYDEKTNTNIKNITKRLSLSHDQIQAQNMIGKAVWFGDVLSLKEYPSSMLNQLDVHGNTPLSLATRLGHDSVSHSLLEMGADPMVELICGWNVIQEAVLNKDNRLVRDLLIHQIQLRGNRYESRNKEIISQLKTMPDFQLEIKWQITSTLSVLNSLIDKFAKIDNFKIWKKGTSIRFDMFMRGFSAQGVEKGHISFLFNESGTLSIDHDRKTFTNAIRKYKNPDFDEMEREIRVLMRTEQGRASLRTSNVIFERKKGWMGGDKTELIENYQCDVMSTKNLSHSIIEDKRKSDNDTKYKWQHPSFDEYFDEQNNDKKNNKSKLKKKMKLKKKTSKFDKKYFPSYIHRKDQPVDVTLWLCQNYPLKDDDISILLEAISIASEDMRRLADIFKLKFPGGFPVKLTMPIVVGISASATFCNFQKVHISDNVFKVPSNYRMV